MKLLDGTAAFGMYRTRVFRFARTARELLDEMDFCGIDQALVYHTAQRFDLPAVGNERLVDEIKGHPRLLPSWAVLPTATAEQPPAEELLAAMRAHGVRALRLFPQDHRYFLDEVSWGDQLALYQERHIPLFIRAGLGKIASFLRSFPDLIVVTDAQGANPLDRYAWPLLERYPNLYYETSGYLTAGIIEEFCRRYGAGRLLFSSGFPDYAAGAALLTLLRAEIEDHECQAIAHDNLARLLSEVQLQ